ncbi:MAG: DNA gyrase inhibitor YacG [Kofleriaceae bacterium]
MKVDACPTCKRASPRDGNKVFPFCCERCQLVDLGRWLNEDYRIPAELAPDAKPGTGDPET